MNCAGQLACECRADGSCDVGSCKSVGEGAAAVNKCIKAAPKCLYGENGCPCDVGKQDCGSAFNCVDDGASGGVCVKKATECSDGDLGCFCTAAKGCNDAAFTCINSPGQPRGFCTLNAAPNEVCVRGEANCACLKLKCNDADVTCEIVDGFDEPQCLLVVVEDTTPASTPALALAAALVALIASLHHC
eukprot:TRINITY_DN1404_c0_g1_i1.p2 TRINITY_DN1404_c0_g1~~TRINITY_DN1404_c0_g1_i1.p2  ORF type:complete len:189 (-),score=120.22 TRINITY_DN1404_c0_g1_i1:56-622(-)